MKILIINGSHRKGNTDIIVEAVVKELKMRSGNVVDELKLREIEMGLPDGCEYCGESQLCPNIRDQFATEIEPSIRNYDVYIIATPTWSDGITPLTKIFWDRIVSWCADDTKYLKDKKIGVITHGMAGRSSWRHVTNWIRSICVWEEAQFVGALTCSSGSKVGSIVIKNISIKNFVRKLLH